MIYKTLYDLLRKYHDAYEYQDLILGDTQAYFAYLEQLIGDELQQLFISYNVEAKQQRRNFTKERLEADNANLENVEFI